LEQDFFTSDFEQEETCQSKAEPVSYDEKSREPIYKGQLQLAAEDFTLIPKVLDARLERYDLDGYLHSTIIKPTSSWKLLRQDSLLDPMRSTYLNEEAIDSEKKRAFDLLDAISRSGTLAVPSAELHVIVAVSHCFEHSVMDTIIRDNINPIDKIENSLLLLASVIHGVKPSQLVGDDGTLQRLRKSFPDLIEGFEGEPQLAVE
jgi:hypothetical protein